MFPVTFTFAAAVTTKLPIPNAVVLPVTVKLASAVIVKAPVPKVTCEASGSSIIAVAISLHYRW